MQVDSCHNLDPLQMICIKFQTHNHHSLVKVKRNCGLEFFKIKLQSLIYNTVCYIHIINIASIHVMFSTSLLLASNNI